VVVTGGHAPGRDCLELPQGGLDHEWVGLCNLLMTSGEIYHGASGNEVGHGSGMCHHAHCAFGKPWMLWFVT
jgi:hypothetical protein